MSDCYPPGYRDPEAGLPDPPTLDEIAERAAAVRRTWCPVTRAARRVSRDADGWDVPRVPSDPRVRLPASDSLPEDPFLDPL